MNAKRALREILAQLPAEQRETEPMDLMWKLTHEAVSPTIRPDLFENHDIARPRVKPTEVDEWVWDRHELTGDEADLRVHGQQLLNARARGQLIRNVRLWQAVRPPEPDWSVVDLG